MKLNRFAKFAWLVVGYNILVILWGAFVRASGSGAGCGSHWPLCNGEVIPMNPGTERIIEFTHRTMSGVALVLVVGLIVWAFRSYPWGRVRYAALASGFFILTEALLGASLVLFGWVGMDQSVMRVYSMGLHLVNTFLLLAAMTLTAWWASEGNAIQLRGQPARVLALAVALLGVIVVGMSGAVTALGDTLFPAASLAQGIQQDLNPTAHFLVQLRVIHPLIAIGVGAYLMFLTVILTNTRVALTRPFAVALRLLVAAQWIAGVVNIVLLAPIWMQIAHLLLADLVWLVLILFAACMLAAKQTSVNQAVPSERAVGAPAE
jgi:heme A synthase